MNYKGQLQIKDGFPLNIEIRKAFAYVDNKKTYLRLFKFEDTQIAAVYETEEDRENDKAENNYLASVIMTISCLVHAHCDDLESMGLSKDFVTESASVLSQYPDKHKKAFRQYAKRIAAQVKKKNKHKQRKVENELIEYIGHFVLENTEGNKK